MSLCWHLKCNAWSHVSWFISTIIKSKVWAIMERKKWPIHNVCEQGHTLIKKLSEIVSLPQRRVQKHTRKHGTGSLFPNRDVMWCCREHCFLSAMSLASTFLLTAIAFQWRPWCLPARVLCLYVFSTNERFLKPSVLPHSMSLGICIVQWSSITAFDRCRRMSWRPDMNISAIWNIFGWYKKNLLSKIISQH